MAIKRLVDHTQRLQAEGCEDRRKQELMVTKVAQLSGELVAEREAHQLVKKELENLQVPSAWYPCGTYMSVGLCVSDLYVCVGGVWTVCGCGLYARVWGHLVCMCGYEGISVFIVCGVRGA